MKNAALRFPELVAQTPMRTHAILTKYTALISYHNLYGNTRLPAFEVAAVYAMILQEAYLDYKTLAGNLQVQGFEVSAGKMKLLGASEYREQIEEAKKERLREAERKRKAVEAIEKGSVTGEGNTQQGVITLSSDASDNDKGSNSSKGKTTKDQNIDDDQDNNRPEKIDTGEVNDKKKKFVNNTKEKEEKASSDLKLYWKPIKITKEYAPTIQGLEDARSMVRAFLIRIVQEINILSSYPELALEQDRVQPHMSPFLFKELLPVSTDKPSWCIPLLSEMQYRSDSPSLQRMNKIWKWVKCSAK